MPSTLDTAPSGYPVTLSEAKAHLRVLVTDDDAYISGLIKAATAEVENYTSRALLTQTWDVFLDCFKTEMEMPKGPLQSATITYVDIDGATQTLAASVYTVDANNDPGFIRLAYGQSWPSVRDQVNAITVQIVCGYGNKAAVPMPIKQAMLIHIAHLYEMREVTISGTIIASVPMSYESLLSAYRVVRF
jgi:uncharacterized phiE125 gp8 family phage protein